MFHFLCLQPFRHLCGPAKQTSQRTQQSWSVVLCSNLWNACTQKCADPVSGKFVYCDIFPRSQIPELYRKFHLLCLSLSLTFSKNLVSFTYAVCPIVGSGWNRHANQKFKLCTRACVFSLNFQNEPCFQRQTKQTQRKYGSTGDALVNVGSFVVIFFSFSFSFLFYFIFCFCFVFR